MKSFKSLVKPACAIVLALGMIAPMVALAKGDNCKAGQHHMGHRAKTLNKWVKALDLTDAQKIEVQALQTQMKAAREVDRGLVKEQRQAFHNLVVANASEAELKAQADQIASNMSNHMVQGSLHMRAFRDILTTEQLAKMDAMKAERKAKRTKPAQSES